MKTRNLIFKTILLVLLSTTAVMSQTKTNNSVKKEKNAAIQVDTKPDNIELFGFGCPTNTIGWGVKTGECGKIKIEGATSQTYYRVRFEWRESFTSNWSHQTENAVNGNFDFYIPWVDENKQYDIRIKVRNNYACSFKKIDGEIKVLTVRRCIPVTFNINDNSGSYCNPITMTSSLSFGVNRASTTFNLCELDRYGSPINCVSETWNYLSNVPATLDLTAWAVSKGMGIRQQKTYSFEINASPETYISKKLNFQTKRFRDCIVLGNPIDVYNEIQNTSIPVGPVTPPASQRQLVKKKLKKDFK